MYRVLAPEFHPPSRSMIFVSHVIAVPVTFGIDWTTVWFSRVIGRPV